MRKRKRPVINFNGVTHESTAQARARVLRVARRRGSITNRQARIIGKWNQAWYHLNAMVKARLLKYEGFNTWKPR